MAPPRPPFATDEPESIYETPNHPQRRIRQQQPIDPNSRTSAYNVYDNYLNHNDSETHLSGIGADFLNGSLDDDDDQLEEKNPFTTDKEKEASKHAMLAAATGSRTPSPPPQYAARQNYTAPMPPPTALLPSHGLTVNTTRNPSMNRGPYNPPPPPQPVAVPSTPHPLRAPITPITPVFARPKKDIQFDEEKPIMRGAREGPSIPNRGEKGDDFWRRFSMVIREENSNPHGSKQSSWLKNTQGRYNTMARWVFFIGIILTVCVVAAIVLWYYVDHKSTGNETQPSTFGGSANEGAATTIDDGSTIGMQSSLYSSPTNNARRAVETFSFHKRHHKRNFIDDLS